MKRDLQKQHHQHAFLPPGFGASHVAIPMDPTALIVSDSGNIEFTAGGPVGSGALMVFQNFLYCNGTGSFAPISGGNCTTGSAGSAASDIINSHFPPGF